MGGRNRTATRPRSRLAVLIAFALLAGCAGTEMPENDAAGTDRLKRSPCACNELDYRPGSYEWLG